MAELARSVSQAPGERSRPGSSRPPISLKDLAKAAVDRQDDERMAVAKQSLTHATRARHSGEAMSQVAAAAEARSKVVVEEKKLEPPKAPEQTESPKAAEASPAIARAVPPPSPSQRQPARASRTPLVVGGLMGFMGLAAAAMFYLQSINHPLMGKLGLAKAPAPEAVSVAQVAPKPADQAKGEGAAPKAANPDEAPAPAADQGNAEPSEPGAAPKPGGRSVAVAGRGAPRGKAAETEKAKEEPAKKAEEAKPEAVAKAPGSLKEEIERRAATAKDKKAAAETETYSDKLPPAHQDNRPLEPSTGDVSAAILRVKPAAQACLQGQTGSATASVTFGSDGRVQGVNVSGPAAGAAGGCIRSALSGARVSPFSKPSFGVSTTIRPVARAASD